MSPRTLLFVLLALVAVAGSSLSCRETSPRATHSQKLVVIGFDGLDPDLVRQWASEGKLPTFARLIDQGTLAELDTTHSPESPTAWASFATGVNAGKHNIYDFLVRDTSSYLIDLGMVERIPGRFLFNYIPVRRPEVRSIRGGTSFWVTAGRAGVRSRVLTVPVTYPPEDVPAGELLSGLPLPDIRGTMGTFSYFATDLSRYEEGNTEFGGILKRLVFEAGVASTQLSGPPNPLVRQRISTLRDAEPNDRTRAELAELHANADVLLPMRIEWRRGSKRAVIDLDGQRVALEQGAWSAWVNLEFRINALVRLQGMAQLYLIGADDELQLYVSPVNWKPDAPPLPMSAPERLSSDLYDKLGPFRTLGWAEATWPLEEGRIDEQAFMDDLYRAFDDRAQVILDRLSAGNWDLFVGVIESTDRVQHMMWRLIDPQHPMYDAALAARHGDAIERVYRRSDQFLAEVLERLDPNIPVLVVSDHGFNSWRKAVNLNTWLVQEGFMGLKSEGGFKKLDDLFGAGGQFWEQVDWAATRAYAMGLGQIYFNLRGREGKGIVSPGAEYQALTRELSARLMTMTDPDTGAPIVRSVYPRDAVYQGPYLNNASDLQVGFHEGYRVSWQTALGGTPAGIVYPNMKKWSADHGSFDREVTTGTLISSRRLDRTRYDIMDIAPTVLKYFNVPIPPEVDGKPIF